MTDLTTLTREAKEAFLDSKMEKIRQKNKELHQRYLEIEADKQNAEVNSEAALAKQLSQDGTGEKIPPRSLPKTTTPKPRKSKPEPSSNLGFNSSPEDLNQRRCHQRLSEDENPPPDPSYNFLFDRLRVGNESDEQRFQSRRHPSNYGGQDFSNVKNTIQIRKKHEREHPRGPPRTKMEMALTMTGHERTQYEEWKRVQDECDKQRLARQKTASGEWRREWDRDKIVQDDDDDVWRRPNNNPPRGRGGGRGALFGRGGQRDRGRGGRGGGGGDRGERSISPSRVSRGRGRAQRRPNNKRYSDSSSDADTIRSPTDRRVSGGRDFLQIRVSNDFVPPANRSPEAQGVEKPVETRFSQQRPRRVGSGRVMSTSSQSEDERVFEETRKDFQIKIECDIEKGEEKDVGKETEGSVDESGGGDESWEDLTTSGNESQDLSCPTDDVPSQEERYDVDKEIVGDVKEEAEKKEVLEEGKVACENLAHNIEGDLEENVEQLEKEKEIEEKCRELLENEEKTVDNLEMESKENSSEVDVMMVEGKQENRLEQNDIKENYLDEKRDIKEMNLEHEVKKTDLKKEEADEKSQQNTIKETQLEQEGNNLELKDVEGNDLGPKEVGGNDLEQKKRMGNDLEQEDIEGNNLEQEEKENSLDTKEKENFDGNETVESGSTATVEKVEDPLEHGKSELEEQGLTDAQLVCNNKQPESNAKIPTNETDTVVADITCSSTTENISEVKKEEKCVSVDNIPTEATQDLD